jgi:hypothetical protein
LPRGAELVSDPKRARGGPRVRHRTIGPKRQLENLQPYQKVHQSDGIRKKQGPTHSLQRKSRSKPVRKNFPYPKKPILGRNLRMHQMQSLAYQNPDPGATPLEHLLFPDQILPKVSFPDGIRLPKRQILGSNLLAPWFPHNKIFQGEVEPTEFKRFAKFH